MTITLRYGEGCQKETSCPHYHTLFNKCGNIISAVLSNLQAAMFINQKKERYNIMNHQCRHRLLSFIMSVTMTVAVITPAHAMTDGERIYDNDPRGEAMVKVIHKNKSASTYNLCSGTVITAPDNHDKESTWIITAKHCLKDNGAYVNEVTPHDDLRLSTLTPDVTSDSDEDTLREKCSKNSVPMEIIPGVDDNITTIGGLVLAMALSLGLGIPFFKYFLPKWTQGIFSSDETGSSEPSWKEDVSDMSAIHGLTVIDSKHFEHSVVDVFYPNAWNDIAILKMRSPAREITPRTLSPENVTKNQRVIGYGFGPDGKLRVDEGYVHLPNNGISSIYGYYDTGRIMGGDSGGALTNTDGDLVGINVTYNGEDTIDGVEHSIFGSMPISEFYPWIYAVITQ